MNKVAIVPVKGQTTLINPFQGNPEIGFIKLEQSKLELGRSWGGRKTRTALYKAELSVLQEIIDSATEKDSKGNPLLPGKIVVQEFVESQVPADIQRDFYNRSLSTLEEQATQWQKTAGSDDDAPVCMLGGERIIRVGFWSPDGSGDDILVAHDNGQEISDLRAVQKERAQDAGLPGHQGA